MVGIKTIAVCVALVAVAVGVGGGVHLYDEMQMDEENNTSPEPTPEPKYQAYLWSLLSYEEKDHFIPHAASAQGDVIPSESKETWYFHMTNGVTLDVRLTYYSFEKYSICYEVSGSTKLQTQSWEDYESIPIEKIEVFRW